MKEKRPEQSILEYAKEVLNDALFHDQISMEDLMTHAVYCEDGLVNSRIVPKVEASGRKCFTALGVINAIVKEVDGDDVRQLGAKSDNYGRLVSFEIVSSKEMREARESTLAAMGSGRMKNPKEMAEEREKQQKEREAHYAKQRRGETGGEG